MWLLFHRNAKTRAVKDGEKFVQECPGCGETAKFIEVELEESYGVFFVDFIEGDKERAYRCTCCGEVFDAKDDAAKPAPAKTEAPAAPQRPARHQLVLPSAPPTTQSLAVIEKQQALEAQRRREAAEVKAVRIEDELAALKKRLGK
jgi:uncharacterized C2H2 Zn-finger protein